MELIEAAVEYSKIGWSVIPIRALDDPHPDDPDNDKRPYVKWKKHQGARADEAQIRAWWKKWPKARVGIVTGKISNIVAIDFDGPGTREKFEAQICELPDTIMQNTGRIDGGFHALFVHPGGKHNLRPVVGDDHGVDGIDVRADGAYIVVAPSPHKSGRIYTWGKIDPIEHGLDDLLDLPQEVLDFCNRPSKFHAPKKVTEDTYDPDQPRNKPGWVNDLLWGVREGQRNHSCAKLAGYYLRFFGGDVDNTTMALEGWNTRNDPPLNRKEIQKVVDSIKSREGVTNFSTIVGSEIDYVEILKYPDGDVKYNLYVAGLDNHIQLTPEELVHPRKFRVKFMILTKRVLKPIKEDVWFNMVEGALKDAPELVMSEDETNIAIIKRLILMDISKGEHVKPEAHLENIAVIYRERVHLYINTIAKQLLVERVKFNSAKELGATLRGIGFKNGMARFPTKMCRTWHIDLDKFERSCALDELVPEELSNSGQEVEQDTDSQQHP